MGVASVAAPRTRAPVTFLSLEAVAGARVAAGGECGAVRHLVLARACGGAHEVKRGAGASAWRRRGLHGLWRLGHVK